jgi:hypothetical protein
LHIELAVLRAAPQIGVGASAALNNRMVSRLRYRIATAPVDYFCENIILYFLFMSIFALDTNQQQRVNDAQRSKLITHLVGWAFGEIRAMPAFNYYFLME